MIFFCQSRKKERKSMSMTLNSFRVKRQYSRVLNVFERQQSWCNIGSVWLRVSRWDLHKVQSVTPSPLLAVCCNCYYVYPQSYFSPTEAGLKAVLCLHGKIRYEIYQGRLYSADSAESGYHPVKAASTVSLFWPCLIVKLHRRSTHYLHGCFCHCHTSGPCNFFPLMESSW